jgi:hypothetical protein
MAYSATSLNVPILANTSQSENPNQLDLLYFADFAQAVAAANNGAGIDGTPFYLSHLSSTIIRNAANTTEYGQSNGHGVLSMDGTISMSAFQIIQTNGIHIPGLVQPSSGLKTKYEAETAIFVTNNIYGSAVQYGYFRFGFANSASSPSDGVYFEFWVNGVFDSEEGYFIDSTPINTTWNIVWIKDGTSSSYDTGVLVEFQKIYQLYLGIEQDSSGNFVTNYSINNKTDSIKTSGTASPSSNSHYPTGTADYMTPFWINYGIGAGAGYPSVSPKILMDYIGARIRRPLTREILLYS